jgi:hypothetical protein
LFSIEFGGAYSAALLHRDLPDPIVPALVAFVLMIVRAALDEHAGEELPQRG